nr:MAG TPA: hypothetical protein [Caudoviricetes sp.]
MPILKKTYTSEKRCAILNIVFGRPIPTTFCGIGSHFVL